MGEMVAYRYIRWERHVCTCTYMYTNKYPFAILETQVTVYMQYIYMSTKLLQDTKFCYNLIELS